MRRSCCAACWTVATAPVAGRLAGALRHIGWAEFANEIVTTIKAAGYDVRDSDPRAVRGTDRRKDTGVLQSVSGTVRGAFPPPDVHCRRCFPKQRFLLGR